MTYNPSIKFPYGLDEGRDGKEIRGSISNLRLLLGEALTDEVALEIESIISNTWHAGWGKGQDDAHYDNDEGY